MDPFTIEPELLVRLWTVFANHTRHTQSSQYDHPVGVFAQIAGWRCCCFYLASSPVPHSKQPPAINPPATPIESWQNPAPPLSQNALRGLLAANLSGLETGGYMLVIVRLDAGKATEVRALMSSGSLIADQEICQFVLDHWIFNPKATGVYKLPVLLRTGL